MMQGGDGIVTGIGAPSDGNVLTGVVGNENLQFAAAQRRDVETMVVKRWAQVDVVEEDFVTSLSCDRFTCNE